MAELRSLVMGIIAMLFVGTMLIFFVFTPAVQNSGQLINNPTYAPLNSSLNNLNNSVTSFNSNMTQVAASTTSQPGGLDLLSGISYAISSIGPTFNLVVGLGAGATGVFGSIPAIIGTVIPGGAVSFAETILVVMFGISTILIVLAAIYKWFI